MMKLETPVKKNDIVELHITGLGHEGEGVGRYEGFTLFVPGALPNENVRVKVLKTKKQYGFGKLLEIVEQSESRVEAPCSIYARCGGCQLQHMSYEGQLEYKRQVVVDALERIGKINVSGVFPGKLPQSTEQAELRENAVESVEQNVIVHPTLGMQDPWRYRNKAQVPIGEGEGGLVGGFYAKGTHEIIETDACLIQHADSDRIVEQVKRIATSLGIKGYDENSHTGILRHVVVKVGVNTGERMVVLVTNGRNFSGKDKLVERISREIDGLNSIVQNVNSKRTNVIFGEETVPLWGEDVITDTIGDIRFAISARSFYQVNPVQTEVLYRKALEYAALTGEETVIDAYCGIGTISLFLARKARRVYGVEVVPEAIADAKRNAALNGIGNAEFVAGEAERVIPRWKEAGIAADVIVVDPPRKGCDETLLETIAAMRPDRVVYVSCNPATLARDLRLLEDRGYRTVEVQPVDMFPHTVHVECVAVLKWRGQK